MLLGCALAVGVGLSYRFFEDIFLIVLGILGVAILASVIGVGRTTALLLGSFSLFRWLDRKNKNE